MAKIPLTQENLNSLYSAFEFYFQNGKTREADFSAGNLKWDSLSSFLEDLSDTSGVDAEANYKSAKVAVDTIGEKFVAESNEAKEKVEANMAADREKLEADRKAREEAIKETHEKAKRQIQEQYQRAKAAQTEIANKKLYVKVAAPETVKITEDEVNAYANLKDLAQKNPRQLQEDLSTAIKTKITEKTGLGPITEEAAVYADTVAAEAVANLASKKGVGVDSETAILVAASVNNRVLNNIVPDSGYEEILKQGTNDLARLKMSSYIAKSSALDMVVGPNVRQLIIGYNPADVQVLFMDSPEGATHTLDLGKINDNYQNVLNNPVFSIAEGNIKSRIISYGKEQLLNKLSSLSPDSYLGRFAATKEFQGALNLLRPYTSFEFVGAEGLPGVFGKFVFQFSPESAPFISAFGEWIGVDFGIAPISTSLAPIATEIVGEGLVPVTATIGGEAITGGIAAAGTEIATTVGTGVAVEGATVAATEATIGTVAVAAAPETLGLSLVVGAVVGFIAGIVGPAAISWLTDKYNKNKEMVFAIPIGLAVGFFAGPVSGLMAGIGAFGLAAAANGGMAGIGSALGGVVSSITGAFGAIWATFMASVSGPIIGTLVAFPIFVIFVLIIINSGAYVVPRVSPISGFTGSGIGADCSPEKGPVGVDGPSSNSPIAKRAWEITYDLYQGFWCYWNRSPISPPQYFPNDTLKYPPGYPETFGYEQFIQNPNPTNENGLNLFWCTYLVIKSYSESGNSMHFSEGDGSAQYMFDHFVGLGKSISSSDANPSNVVPGAAIFFHVSSGHSGINHVGIVYTVDQGGIIFVQSNGPLKSQSVNFKAGGGVGSIVVGNVTIDVEGFGLP